MSETRKTDPEIVLVEDLTAPETFADGVPFFALKNGTVTLTLASMRWDNSARPATRKLVVVGRVTMPVAGARDLASGLHDFLEKQGVPAVSLEEKERMQ